MTTMTTMHSWYTLYNQTLACAILQSADYVDDTFNYYTIKIIL